MQDHGSPLLRRLLDRHIGALRDTHAKLGDATALVDRDRLVEVMRFLRDDPELRFDMLTDVTCVDYLGETPRFEMVYHLYSVEKNHRLRIKAVGATGEQVGTHLDHDALVLSVRRVQAVTRHGAVSSVASRRV